MSTTEMIAQSEEQNQTGGMVAVAESRAAQEVQAAMVIAKRFPRDETAAFAKILKACQRKSLAETSMYIYPKGNTTVTGPTIRLAEVLARNWGNLEFGITEVEQLNGESTMLAYAWDLETNCRQTRVFTVKHWRDTKGGGYALSDARDIYEMTANQGARRMRACILGVIPGDFVEAAIAECEKTMRGNNTEPLSDRIRKMIAAFGEFNVSQEMIEERFGHLAESIIEIELVQLRKMYLSIKDNMASVRDLFPPAENGSADPDKTKSEQLAEQLKKKKTDRTKKTAEPKEETPETPEPPTTLASVEEDMKVALDLEGLAEVVNRAFTDGGFSKDDQNRISELHTKLEKSLA